MDENLQQKIDSIPRKDEDGYPEYWKAKTRNTYYVIGDELQAQGMDDDTIVHLLSRLYWATASSFPHV
jgi:hypothetical protein